MLDESQREACTQYVLDQTREVIERFGQRPPGSPGEEQCQRLVRDELSACCNAGVSMESFLVAQKAFMALPCVMGSILLVAYVAYWYSPVLAACLSAFAVAAFVLELGQYKQFLDPFFPKRTSYNVVGRTAPSGELKRRIILNGHPDAAYEWRWLYNAPKFFKLIMICAFGGFGAKFATDLIAACCILIGHGGNIVHWIGYVQILFLPGVLFGLSYASFKHVSFGANDNLSGTFIAAGLAKYLHAAGQPLKNTELVIAITGSEEAGLRGAKAFMQRHRGEFNDVPTIAIALDTFRDLDHMYVYNKDLNGTVAHDPAVCKLLKDAGARCGRDLPYASIFLGGSDGAAFTQAGMRAAALCAMDPSPADYYHNRRDHWKNMDPACIRAAIDVLLEALAAYDAEGLPG